MKKNREPKSFLLESIFLLLCVCLLPLYSGVVLTCGSQTGRTPWCVPWGFPSCCLIHMLISGIFSISFVPSVLHGDCECWGSWAVDPLMHFPVLSTGAWGSRECDHGAAGSHTGDLQLTETLCSGQMRDRERSKGTLPPLCFTPLFLLTLMLGTCLSYLDVEGQYTLL